MKSTYLLTTAAAFAFAVWATGANAASKWDGSDELATTDAGRGETGTTEAGTKDTGALDAAPALRLCGAPPGNIANATSDYGATMYGTEGDDDDCKYHVSYETTPLCENDGVYLIVTAHYLTRDGTPLTGACTQAELCLNNDHVGPEADVVGSEPVVEGPPGTYTITAVHEKFGSTSQTVTVASGKPFPPLKFTFQAGQTGEASPLKVMPVEMIDLAANEMRR